MDIPKVKNLLIDTDKIKTLCEQNGMPFAELGRRIGLNERDLITRRLHNQYAFSADEFCLIADQFGLSLDELRKR